ncbi:hypothetical protein GCM10028815_05180 [Mariniluteicoccus flavus]
MLDAVAVMLLRLLIMVVVVWLTAPLGWYAGLCANLALAVTAVVIVHRRGLWGRLGGLVPRSWTALLWLVPLVADVALWLAPHGLRERPPGFLLWGLTLALVGLNEELFVRGIVLARLEQAYARLAAVVLSSAHRAESPRERQPGQSPPRWVTP